MGCAGNGELHTPNLDRLAGSGIRFENFFCVSPGCFAGTHLKGRGMWLCSMSMARCA
jgi:arylsulfatase A-like enzyme